MQSRDLTYHVGTSGRFFPHVEHVLTVGDVFGSGHPREVPHEVGEVVMDPMRAEFGASAEAFLETLVLPQAQRHLREVVLQTSLPFRGLKRETL